MSLCSDLKEVLTPYAQRIKGLAQKNTELKADLGAVDESLHDQIGIYGKMPGYYINLTTAPVSLTPQSSSTGLAYSIIDCAEGDEFVINAVGASSGRAWGFLDSDNVVLDMADANATVEDLEITAPEGAVKLVINDKSGGTSYKVGSNIASRVTALEAVEPGLSTEAKTALLNLVSHIGVWTDDKGQEYVDRFTEALTGVYPVIKVFIGKGTSGASIIDNAKRAITEPIPFRNEIPITIQRTVSGEDDGYRHSVKWCEDDDTIWVMPSGFPDTRFVPLELDGWFNSSDAHTWCKDVSETSSHEWVPDTFNGDGDGTLRIMFANVDSIDDSLPDIPPQGFIIVQGRKYRLEVGDNDDFV